MSSFDGDILEPISSENLKNYIEICKSYFPTSLRAHHYLLNCSRWKNKTENRKLNYKLPSRCRVTFYSPKNADIKKCTFVGISDENDENPEEKYTIFLYSSEENGEELENCVTKTKRISWLKGPYIVSILEMHYPIIDKFIKIKNLEIDWFIYNTCLKLPVEKAKLIKVDDIPDNIKIAPLGVEHIDEIYPIWKKRSEDTTDYLKAQIVLNGGFGAFDSKTNQLLSWLIKNDYLSLGTFHTLPSEQGKGYGKFVLKSFCKQYAEEEGYDIISIVLVDNLNSLKAFRKIGFEDYDRCYCIKLKKQINNN